MDHWIYIIQDFIESSFHDVVRMTAKLEWIEGRLGGVELESELSSRWEEMGSDFFFGKKIFFFLI